jgi:hypothetical protein
MIKTLETHKRSQRLMKIKDTQMAKTRQKAPKTL